MCVKIKCISRNKVFVYKSIGAKIELIALKKTHGFFYQKLERKYSLFMSV